MSNQTLRILFYAGWLVFALAQAYFVELQGDEAYYWRYSQQLAWGYFDHPPVVALLTKAGYALFHNELGVRFFFVLITTATIFVLEKLINAVNLKLFYALILSVAFLQIGMVFGGGMYALPDFPLLLFTALFLLLYQKYLQQPSPLLIVGLITTTSLLLLSKYHGVLVIGFTVLSNFSLLKRRSFWIIVVLSAVCLLPHILWQINNDYPSVQYHLSGRNKIYSWSYPLEYIGSQPLIAGPLIGFVLFYTAFVFKPNNAFERSLKFITAGVYLFFLVMSFRGRIEGNWTIMTLIPLLYMGYHEISKREKLKRATFILFAISTVLVVAVRMLLISNWKDHPKLKSTLGVKESVADINAKFGDASVAFMNSYQKASLYEFYTGNRAISLNNIYGRNNQYTLWDTEYELQGKTIFVVANYKYPSADTVLSGGVYYPYYTVENFRSFSNIRIISDLPNEVYASPGQELTVNVRFNNWNRNPRDLEAGAPSYLRYSFLIVHNTVSSYDGFLLKNDMIDNGQAYSLQVKAPKEPGTYSFFLSVATKGLPSGLNSKVVKFIVQ